MHSGHSCKGCFHTVIDYKDDSSSATILFEPGMTDVKLSGWVLNTLNLKPAAEQKISLHPAKVFATSVFWAWCQGAYIPCQLLVPESQLLA